MAKYTIDKAPEWVRKLEGKMHKAAMRGLLSAAQRTVSHIQTEIIPREERVPVDRGTYRAGWRARPIEGFTEGALVYNNVPHAEPIENGAKAENIKIGRKLIDALAEWVIRKGLTGAAKGVERAAEGRRIAWAIAKSMQKNGIFNKGGGLKILEKATKMIPQFIAEEVRAEIRAIRD